MTTLDIGITVAYLAGVLAIGYWVSRSITGFRDYFVAGGRMTTPLLVCTLVSTYYGLDVLLGLPFVWGVLIGAVISLIYTLMGGLLADAFTDTIQFTLMCVSLGIAAILVLDELGGVDTLPAVLPASYFDPQGTYPLPVLLVFATGALSIMVEPAIYQRIFAARSQRAVSPPWPSGSSCGARTTGSPRCWAGPPRRRASRWSPATPCSRGWWTCCLRASPGCSSRAFANRRLKPAAGLASSLVGLATVTGVYVAVNVFGVESTEWGTVIWTVHARGRHLAIWQEYAVLSALPASAVAFVLGQASGRPAHARTPRQGAPS